VHRHPRQRHHARLVREPGPRHRAAGRLFPARDRRRHARGTDTRSLGLGGTPRHHPGAGHPRPGLLRAAEYPRDRGGELDLATARGRAHRAARARLRAPERRLRPRAGMRARRWFPALCAAALLLDACALSSKFIAPRLSVVDVQIEHGDLWEQRLKVRMRVQNPNDRRLPVKGLEYTLEVEGQQLASGASVASFVVPAMGEAEFDMDVTTNLAGALLKLLGRGSEAPARSVAYRVTGRIALAEGLMRSIPFEERGSFSLRCVAGRAPRTRLPGAPRSSPAACRFSPPAPSAAAWRTGR